MRFRELVLRNIVSPYGLAAASLLFFLVAWVFPPATYSFYVQEPDLMFLDPASLLFFLFCVLAFVLGLMLIDFFYPVSQISREEMAVRISPMWFVLLPVLAGTVLTVISSVLLLRANVNLIDLLLSGEAGQIKSAEGIEAIGSIGLAPVVLMGIVWWAIWRKHQLAICGWQKVVVGSALIVATVAMLVSATLKMGRGEFMPIIAGIVILFLSGRVAQGRLTLRSASGYAAIFVTLVVVLFAAFSMLRGLVDSYWLIADLLGYTIASYNRLAAVLSGRLHYPFAGRGIYLSSFVTFNDTFNQVFPINKLYSWPDFIAAWQSEFGAVSLAGLNSDMIWSGAFGYLFSDLGWFSPIMLFLYGLGTGWAWRSLKLGRTAGIVLYPWCAFCILFWFGTNFLLDTKGIVLLLVAALLGFYERLFVRAPEEATQA